MARSQGREDFSPRKRRGHGGIAAEEDTIAAGLDGVAVIAAVGIAAHAGAPVLHLEGADFERTDAGAFAPGELVDGGVAMDAQQVGGAGGGDHRGGGAFQTAQAADIEVIHVGMGEQDEVDFRQLGEAEGGLDQTLQAEREGAEADAGARAEDGVGEDGDAVDLEQHGGMAEPGGMEAGIGPGMRMGTMGRGQNLALEVPNDTTPVHLNK